MTRVLQKNLRIILLGTAYIALAVLAALSSFLSVAGYSQGHATPSIAKWFDIPYGILMGAFDSTLGIPLFFIYFVGAQSLVALLIAVLAVFLILGKEWARIWLLIFSCFNWVVLALMSTAEIPRLAAGASWNARSLGIGFGILFYSVSVLVLTRKNP
jgi:hypothetical protein